MAETLIEKVTCVKCGSDVRENTQFCYNCGTPVAENAIPDEELSQDTAVEEESPGADDLASRIKIEEPSEEKLAKAAEERRRARVERRKPKDYSWVPAEPPSAIFLLLISVVIALLVGLVVFFGVVWK